MNKYIPQIKWQGLSGFLKIINVKIIFDFIKNFIKISTINPIMKIFYWLLILQENADATHFNAMTVRGIAMDIHPAISMLSTFRNMPDLHNNVLQNMQPFHQLQPLFHNNVQSQLRNNILQNMQPFHQLQPLFHNNVQSQLHNNILQIQPDVNPYLKKLLHNYDHVRKNNVPQNMETLLPKKIVHNYDLCSLQEEQVKLLRHYRLRGSPPPDDIMQHHMEHQQSCEYLFYNCYRKYKQATNFTKIKDPKIERTNRQAYMKNCVNNMSIT